MPSIKLKKFIIPVIKKTTTKIRNKDKYKLPESKDNRLINNPLLRKIRSNPVKIWEKYLILLEIDFISSINPIHDKGKLIKGIYQPNIEQKIADENEKMIPAPVGIGFLCELLATGLYNKYFLKNGKLI